MKRILLTLACIIAFAYTLCASPRAVGGRVGNGVWASYQHYTGNDHIIQIDLGWSGFSKNARGLEAAFTFNWEHEIGTNWYVIYGFGIGGGYEFSHLWREKLWVNEYALNEDGTYALDENGSKIKTGSKRVWSNNSAYHDVIRDEHLEVFRRTGDGFAGYAGLMLNLSFEYQLSSVPLAIGLDWRPLIGVDFGRRGKPGMKPVNTETHNYNFQARYHMRGLLDFGLTARYLF